MDVKYPIETDRVTKAYYFVTLSAESRRVVQAQDVLAWPLNRVQLNSITRPHWMQIWEDEVDGKENTAAQMIPKLREAEVEMARGRTGGQVCNKNGVTERAYYHWR